MHRFANWRVTLGLWIATLAVFGLYLVYVQPLKDFLAPDIYLDLRFDGYDHPEATAFFDYLGPLGRAFYMRSTIFDTIWPLMLGLSGFLMARQVFNKWWLIFVFAVGPVGFGLLDLVENIGLFAMNFQFPDISESLVATSNIVTLSKQKLIPLAFGSFFLTPLVAIGFWVRNTVSHANHHP
jgi:hypothetical protein